MQKIRPRQACLPGGAIVRASAKPSCRLMAAVWSYSFAALLSLFGAGASAQSTDAPSSDPFFKTVFTVDPNDPEAHIPSLQERNRAPVAFGNYLVNLSDAAEQASKAGDHAKALKFYRAIAAAVPDRSIGFSKQCEEYLALGERAKAEQVCATALSLPGVRVDDYVRYVHTVLRQAEPLTTKQLGDVDSVVAHLREVGAGDAAADLACLVGLKLMDAQRLTRCVTELQKQAPNGAQTIGYEWRLALVQLDKAAARRAVARAKQYALDPALIQQMELATNKLMRPWERTARRWLPTVLPVFVGLLAIAAWMSMRRRSLSFGAGLRVRDSKTELR